MHIVCSRLICRVVCGRLRACMCRRQPLTGCPCVKVCVGAWVCVLSRIFHASLDNQVTLVTKWKQIILIKPRRNGRWQHQQPYPGYTLSGYLPRHSGGTTRGDRAGWVGGWVGGWAGGRVGGWRQ